MSSQELDSASDVRASELRARRELAVSRVGLTALSGVALWNLFDEAFAALAEVLGTERCEVLEWRPEKQDFLVVGGLGEKPGRVGRAVVPGRAGDSQAGFTLHSREPVVVEDLRAETRFRTRELLEEGLVSGLSAVAQTSLRAYGVLSVHTRERRAFAAEDVNFVEAFARILGAAIERKRVDREILEGGERLRRSEARLAEAQTLTHIGSWEWDVSADVMTWSDELHRIYGVPREEFGGRFEDAMALVHAADRERVRRAVEDACREGGSYLIEHGIVRPDGSVRFLEARGRVADEPGQPRWMVGTGQDITERVRAQRFQRLRLALAKLLVEPSLEDSAVAGALQAIGEDLGAGVVEFWRWDAEGDSQRLAASWHLADPALEDLACERGGIACPAGPSLVPLVRRTDRPVVVEDTAHDARLNCSDHCARAGLCWAVALPVRTGQRVDGAIVLFASARPAVLDTGAMGEFEEVGQRFGELIERKRVESALRQSEEMFRRMVETAQEGIWTIDWEGRTTFANARMAAMLGYEPGEMIGRSFLDFVEPDLLDDAVATLERRRSGISEDHDFRLRRRDGACVWTRLVTSPLFDGEGQLVGTLAMVADVTEARRREEQERLLLQELAARVAVEEAHRRAVLLAEASRMLGSSLEIEATLSSLARLAVPAIADLCVVYLADRENPTGRQVTVAHVDPARAELVRSLEERFPRDPSAPRGVAQVLRTGESELYPRILDEHVAGVARDEEHLAILRGLGMHSGIVVPMTAHGAVVGAIVFVGAEARRSYGQEDLALAEELGRRAAIAVENARLYREARDAISLRDEFLSIASHELRTPLAALRLQIESLERLLVRAVTGGVPERAFGKVSAASRQVDRLARLVDELLEVSRIATGRLRLEPEPFDLAELAADLVERFGDEAAVARCDLALSANGPARGVWDRLRLEQVLSNLLANAIRYAPGSPVTVAVRSVDGRAMLSVRDRGPGIAEGDLERIFERFERAAAPAGGGLGLGLYIARQIVDAHGGRIEVESSPGRGALFTVSLPLEGTGS